MSELDAERIWLKVAGAMYAASAEEIARRFWRDGFVACGVWADDQVHVDFIEPEELIRARA